MHDTLALAIRRGFFLGSIMNFGHALELLHEDQRLTRRGWNGKGMFIYLVDGSKFLVSRAPLDKFHEIGEPVDYRPHIDMKYADGTCGVWTATMSDILANDWDMSGLGGMPYEVQVMEPLAEKHITITQVDNGEYSVSGGILPLGDCSRHRPTLVKSTRIDHSFCIQTPNGTQYGYAGDYLLQGVDAELYVIPASRYKNIYDVAPPSVSPPCPFKGVKYAKEDS